jgi:hypothetical protein
MSHKAHMNGGGESHNGVVPAKRSNESQGGLKEIVEGRPLTEENVNPPIAAPDTEPNEWANNGRLTCQRSKPLSG